MYLDHAIDSIGDAHQAPRPANAWLPTSAAIILSGIEMIHMMRKRQARYAYNPNPSLVEQFENLAAQLTAGLAASHFHSAVATEPTDLVA